MLLMLLDICVAKSFDREVFLKRRKLVIHQSVGNVFQAKVIMNYSLIFLQKKEKK